MKRGDHIFEVDLRPGGKGSGFKRLNPETGKEDIRTRPFPGSKWADVHQRVMDAKRKGKK